MKKIICLCLVLVMLCPMFVACADEGGVKMLSFAEAQSISDMKRYDGKEVTIIGYMSTLSPASGKFMYLMNMPYQSCPFCIPNTNQLSNTMAIYAKDGKSFEFTDRLIQVKGTMDFCDSGAYEDELGYEYGYRIVNATYEILNTDDMSDELREWQEISASGIVSEIYEMYNYLNFLCNWTQYTADFGGGRDYLYPTDVEGFFKYDGAQYNYGYQDGYFDNIIAKVETYDSPKIATLVDNIKQAKELSAVAISELESGNYDQVTEYSGIFGDGRVQYKLRNYEMQAKNDELYRAFANWLASWEI